MNIRRKVLFIITVGILGAVALYFWNEDQKNYPEWHTYETQAECERETKRFCGHETCDFIPEGKTFEEACGKGYKPGWVPNPDSADIAAECEAGGGELA